jgi:hypothetical protein
MSNRCTEDGSSRVLATPRSARFPSTASKPPVRGKKALRNLSKVWRTRSVLIVAAAIVAFRALVLLMFEQVAFDSDQAIVGLMATHLSQGRAFPLFFYGQTYMLAVESWVAVPFFLVAGPTVAALRLSMLAWNLAFAVFLIAGLQRDTGLRPWTAFVPALFFMAAPVAISLQLMTAQGGIIEPFVYVAALWFLRRRPLWFGAILAIGFRNREFTLYAVPVLLTLEFVMGELNRVRIGEWLMSLAIFCAVWEVVEALKPFADLAGPGTRGQVIAGFSGSQVDNLLERFAWQTDALAERLQRLGPELLAWFAGANQGDAGLSVTHRPWLTWAAGTFVILAGGRLAFLTTMPSGDSTLQASSIVSRLQHQVRRASFAFYVLGVGIVAVAVFVAGKPFLTGYSRYAIFGLLIPVGLTAAILALESRQLVRRIVTVAVSAWAALALVDHTRLLAAVVRNPPASPNQQIADRLVEKHIPVASAGYWRAYVIAFLAGERVRVASNDLVRIQEYQDLFVEQMSKAVVISEKPCPDGEAVASLYLCKP